MNFTALVLTASLAAAPGTKAVVAKDDVATAVMSVWQRAASGEQMWTPRAIRAQRAYDAFCLKNTAPGLCRPLAAQAVCGAPDGEVRGIAVSKSGKFAEIVGRLTAPKGQPDAEGLPFVVRLAKLDAGWRVDSVRCPSRMEDAGGRDTGVPPVVDAAVKSLRHDERRVIGNLVAEVLPGEIPVPSSDVSDPWEVTLPGPDCHVGESEGEAEAVAGMWLTKGVVAEVRTTPLEPFLAYFEKDAAGKAHLVDTRCLVPWK